MSKRIFLRQLLSKVAFLMCIQLIFDIRFIEADSRSRPMLISLPINVRTSIPVGPSPAYDLAESAEEQRVNERFVPRGHDHPDYPSEDADTENGPPQPGFLAWNPANNYMTLQLNDYIGGRNAEQGNQQHDSEEYERTEDTRSRKRKSKPPQHQTEFMDMEDYGRISNSRGRPRSSKKTKVSESEKKLKYVDQSAEEEGREVYGAEPVVHYLRENKKRKRNNRKMSMFDTLQQDENDNFNFKDWWGDY